MSGFANCPRCATFHMVGGPCNRRLMPGIAEGCVVPTRPFAPPAPVPATNVFSMAEHREAVSVKTAAARKLQRETDLMVARCFATAAGKDFLSWAMGQPYGAQLKTDVNTRIDRCVKFWNTKPSEENA